MPEVEMTGLSPNLKARDIDETIAFYTSVLGFELVSRMDNEEEGYSWCALTSGSTQIMFNTLGPAEEEPALTGTLYFNPADVRLLWDELKDWMPIEWPLEEMPYGMLEFAIRDCNGYVLVFGQAIETEAEAEAEAQA
jgi:catechol 2,3-dioxygenase-like lactoylglutathione lyase family enzyme